MVEVENIHHEQFDINEEVKVPNHDGGGETGRTKQSS